MLSVVAHNYFPVTHFKNSNDKKFDICSLTFQLSFINQRHSGQKRGKKAKQFIRFSIKNVTELYFATKSQVFYLCPTGLELSTAVQLTSLY